MVKRKFMPSAWGVVTTALLATAILIFPAPGPENARADVPNPPATLPFTAPLCAGTTDWDPTTNTGYEVVDLTEVFGERLTNYNAGHIVPLYDSVGGSALLADDGTNTGDAAYPPICGTRYVAELGTAVSEWMYCTDLEALSCGDTDAQGRLVNVHGEILAPMTPLDRNPKLSVEQEKLIAYLIQHGHSYAGVGSQFWGGATEARSDLGSNERMALQTLVWCVSDPVSTNADFIATCAANMDATEQARLLSMIPTVAALDIQIQGPGATLMLGETAHFTISTNIFNQPIQVVFGGTANAQWSVCSGNAVLTGSVLTVSGTDPEAAQQVVLCATATAIGTATLEASATPPAMQHIGWHQSVNPLLSEPCQVYAAFHTVEQVTVRAASSTDFLVSKPTAPKLVSTAASTPLASVTASR